MDQQTPKKQKLPLIGILTKRAVLDPVSVKELFAKSRLIQCLTSTRAEVWTPGVMPSSPQIQNSWTLGSHLSTQRKNLDLSASPQPESEGQQKYPTVSDRDMILRKLRRTQWAKQKQTATIKKWFWNYEKIQDFERENISMSNTQLTQTTDLKEHFTISPQ